jgi:hypothetical protein
MESRGNSPSYPSQSVPIHILVLCGSPNMPASPRGNDVVRGSLNWGPTQALNAVFKTFGWWPMRRSSYADGFHTYALEWTQDFLCVACGRTLFLSFLF